MKRFRRSLCRACNNFLVEVKITARHWWLISQWFHIPPPPQEMSLSELLLVWKHMLRNIANTNERNIIGVRQTAWHQVRAVVVLLFWKSVWVLTIKALLRALSSTSMVISELKTMHLRTRPCASCLPGSASISNHGDGSNIVNRLQTVINSLWLQAERF